MRIVLCSDTWLPQVNGVSLTLHRLAKHLTARGHELALVTPAQTNHGEGEAEEASSATLHIHRPGRPLPIYPDLLVTLPLGRSAARRLDAFAPDVVHCATESVLGWSVRRWALAREIPLVTSYHTNFATYAHGYGLGRLEGLAWSLLRRFHEPAQVTLCPSRATLQDLARRGFHTRTRLWSRGVDVETFHPRHRSVAWRNRVAPNADVILLHVGRLAPEKRVDRLLAVFPQVRERARQLGGLEVALVLVGHGPLGAELERRSHAGQLPGVHLAGWLEGAELAQAFASADVFAFPSDTETFGNVVLEAMASGLPVVGVNRGGVQDSVRTGRTGVLVPPDSEHAFTDALVDLALNPARRGWMGFAGRQVAEERGWPTILDGVVQTYKEAA